MKPFAFISYLSGFYRIEIAPEDSRRVINALMRRGVEHGNMKRIPNGALSFTVARKDWPELREIIDKCGILVYSVYGKGLPFFVRRYRRRVGFLLGAICFLAVVWLSTQFVWRVEVVSDTEMNTASIIENLRQIGVTEGCFIPKTDCWAKSAEYLSTFDDCSWMSVNIVGTVAKIEVRPMIRGQSEVASGDPCNIVAEHGGVIDSFVIHSGKSYITAGDIVKQGDLLVGGIIEDIGGELRLIESDAEVYAETERLLEVSVSYAHTERVYTGREKKRLSYRFFGAGFTMPFAPEAPEGSWEYTKNSDKLLLPDSTTLPIEKSTEIWREYTEKEEYYTTQQACDIAEYRMNELVSSELARAEILSVTKILTEDEGSVTLSARIRCICNIAKKKEIKKTGENDA